MRGFYKRGCQVRTLHLLTGKVLLGIPFYETRPCISPHDTHSFDDGNRMLCVVEGEDLRMTIQVGMVGSDGLVIAGDTKWMKEPKLENRFWAAGRTGFNSPKIKVSHERGIAISRARDMEMAIRVSDEIVARLKDDEMGSPIAAIENMARGLVSESNEKRVAHCLIGVCKPNPKLFLFQFALVDGEWGPICQPMETIAIVGDNLNPAIFWAERYYEKSRSIRELIPLAAHLVVCAHTLNTATISGLEVVLCDSSGIHRLSNDSIRELELRANEREKDIGNLFLSDTQQFTYAPDVAG